MAELLPGGMLGKIMGKRLLGLGMSLDQESKPRSEVVRLVWTTYNRKTTLQHCMVLNQCGQPGDEVVGIVRTMHGW